MSSRKRAAPGDVQGRNRGDGASRYRSAISTKRIDEGRRAAIHEVGNARRAQVYRDDVEFAPSDAPTPLPAKDSPERAALVAEIVRLRRQGLSHMKIANALYPTWPMWSVSTIGNILRESREK